ncbi:MAG TPA: Lrp/AsnC family transcriptional regulator [Marmoricola sp.]|nr:Lrp/AsnC family transcriptional regulator [Marmoricola sp.]
MIKGEKGVDADRHDSVPSRASRPVLDPVSKAIIEQLQQDGRRSYAAIAQSVGTTEADARERVRDLIDSGVMQIVAVTDPLQLGFARQAMLGIVVDGDRRAVAATIAEVDEVDYVVVTAGDFDVLAEVIGVSDAHLLELVTARIRPIPGVRSIHTYLYEELLKQTYSWGVR